MYSSDGSCAGGGEDDNSVFSDRGGDVGLSNSSGDIDNSSIIIVVLVVVIIVFVVIVIGAVVSIGANVRGGKQHFRIRVITNRVGWVSRHIGVLRINRNMRVAVASVGYTTTTVSCVS